MIPHTFAFWQKSGGWGPNGPVYAVAVIRELPSLPIVLVGGSFTKFNGEERVNFAAFNYNTGELIDAYICNTNGPVYAVAWNGVTSRIYIGGSFSEITTTNLAGTPSTRSQDNLVILDSLGQLRFNTPQTNGAIRCIHAYNSYDGGTVSERGMYLAGDFTVITGRFSGGGATVINHTTNVASVVGSSVLIVSSLSLSCNGTIYAIGTHVESPYGTTELRTVYIGGSFTTIAGVSRNNFAVFETLDPSDIGLIPMDDAYIDAADYSPDGIVYGIATVSDYPTSAPATADAYIAGAFGEWDGDTALDYLIDGPTSSTELVSVDGTARCVKRMDTSKWVAGGEFTNRWYGHNGTSLITGSITDGIVHACDVIDDGTNFHFIIGGSYSFGNPYLSVFDSSGTLASYITS